MLELIDVTKAYVTAGFTQRALDGVSLAFRDNEFAAVLGPSGSGKTTMLNIIGGLDHYDSGDLIIDGISTKRYQARNWDSYRNNRIGFVFQSYNLIMHQTVLANVELALTLSGVGKRERRSRAKKALAEVGLADHIHKKPNQLSGGQMQRVAIARALINDPEILLADEPTGALDSATSDQVMELLGEIARDRLVVMVTHNPELADQYANRIINLRDGHVVGDTRPFDPNEAVARQAGTARKASMAFATAIALSFSNLMTKKGRTFTTALAGSIGIIGIATILALANGIDNYIQGIEEETLSIYPLTVQSVGIDLSAFLDGPDGGGGGGGPGASINYDDDGADVRESRILTRMFTTGEQNDLTALKVYIEANRATFDEYTNLIQYQFGVTPQIFLADTEHGIEQVNPDGALTALGGGGPAAGFGAMVGFGSFGPNSFAEMLGNRDMYVDQYDVLAGRWPEAYNELVLVLSQSGNVTDLNLFSLGLRDRAELREIVAGFVDPTAGAADVTRGRMSLRFGDLLGARLKVVSPADWYTYDSEFNVWVDRSGDQAFMANLIAGSQDLVITGVVRPAEGASITPLTSGINYQPSLIEYLMGQAANIPIVERQLDRPAVNVFTSRTFAAEAADPQAEFDFSRLISVDEELLSEIFAIDPAALDLDISDLQMDGFELDLPDFAKIMQLEGLQLNIDPNQIAGLVEIDLSQLVLPEPPPLDLATITDGLGGLGDLLNLDGADIVAALGPIMLGFLPELEGVTDPADIPALLAAYLDRPEVQQQLTDAIAELLPLDDLEAQVSQAITDALAAAMQSYMAEVGEAMQAQLSAAMGAAMAAVFHTLQTEIGTQLEAQLTQAGRTLETALTDTFGTLEAEITEGMQTAVTAIFEQIADQMQGLDPDALAEAFQVTMDEGAVLELMQAVMNPATSNLERNLATLGYANPDTPTQINIYPRDFASKQEVIRLLDEYNERMDAQGTPERRIVYTDLIGAIMSSVTDILNMVTVGLIAFVGISLVVSSIMIGVITYVSVLERRKEIGILRAIGASKRNIKQVFNAETLIVGFVAGAIGITFTLIIVAIGNAIVFRLQNIRNIASLPLWAALGLIFVSMFLTFIAGLIPAASAARKDPVTALRSD